MERAVDIALGCAKLGPVLRHWFALCRDGVVPKKSDLDPLVMPLSLSHMALFRHEPGVRDYRCVLAGEDVSDSHGAPFKGQRLAELYDPVWADRIRKAWDEVRSTPAILIAISAMPHEGDVLASRRLILPLTESGSAPDMILSVSAYDYNASYVRDRGAPDHYDYTFVELHDIARALR